MIYLCVEFYCVSKIERGLVTVRGPGLPLNHQLKGILSTLKRTPSEVPIEILLFYYRNIKEHIILYFIYISQSNQQTSNHRFFIFFHILPHAFISKGPRIPGRFVLIVLEVVFLKWFLGEIQMDFEGEDGIGQKR